MSADLKVVTLADSNYRQVAPTLRKLADSIENGELGAVGCCAVVCLSDKVRVFGMGPDSNGPATGMVLHAGAAFMTNMLLGDAPDDPEDAA